MTYISQKTSTFYAFPIYFQFYCATTQKGCVMHILILYSVLTFNRIGNRSVAFLLQYSTIIDLVHSQTIYSLCSDCNMYYI